MGYWVSEVIRQLQAHMDERGDFILDRLDLSGDRPTCIIVFGLPRSGTSMVAGILHHLGVQMGPLTDQTRLDPNPKGFFENDKLATLHCQWTGDTALLHWGNLQESYDLPEGWVMTYRTMIRTLEGWATQNNNGLWGFKDLRVYSFCQEFIDAVNSEIKIIVVSRNEEAVRRSMTGYPGVESLDIEKVYQDWVRLRDRALSPQFFGRFLVFPVDYEAIVKDPDWAVFVLAEFVGVKVTDEAIAFIDPLLNRSGRQSD